MKSRRVLITGSAKGIGLAVAEKFLRVGDRVQSLDLMSGRAPGENFSFLECDVSDPNSVARAAAQSSEQFSAIDVLINNAGCFQPALLSQLTPQQWQQCLNQNLTGAFLVTREFLRMLRPGSVIVNISSALGRIPEPEAGAYSVAKAGLNMLTRCLALELAPVQVRVLAVAPGPVASGAEGSQEICQISGENLRGLNPSGRFGTVEEVAELIYFLCSKEASYMTGNIVAQDGGEESFSAAWSGLRALRSSGRVNDAEQLGELLAVAPSDRVRLSVERVVELSSHVQLDDACLEEFCESLSPDEIAAGYSFEADYHPSGGSDEMVDFVFTMDAINFGSGFSSEWRDIRSASTYKTVAAALSKRLLDGGSLGAEFAFEATEREVADLLGTPREFPLVKMFTTALNSFGQYVQEGFGGYQALLDFLPKEGKAQALIQLLTENVPEFDDHALYRGGVVFFYKRAQILVNDLHLALGRESPFSSEEIAELTMFADNLVSHVFQQEGALQYSAELGRKIAQRELLPAGGEEEIEIRAAGIAAVERSCKLLNERSGGEIFPAMLDVYLWNVGQAVKYKGHPRHRTKTFFY